MSTVPKFSQTERFTAIYRITVTDGRTIEAHATDITLEQSVEIPGDCVPEKVASMGVVGQIESITPVNSQENRYDVRISYRCDLTGFVIPQFLNVLYGNISIKRGIKIIGLELPESLFQAFGGPQFGMDGIRKMAGVWKRPLTCTALKPLGLPVEDLVKMCGDYTRGGLDLIKEDHGMADLSYHPFRERVLRCNEAIQKANRETGGNTLYFPMVSGRFDQIESQFALLKEAGIPGVLVAPMLVGLDTIRTLAFKYGLAVMSHPAFTGTHFHDPDHGMTPAILLGTIFRLIGSDISVFPNFGGRFSFSRSECIDLAGALRGPLGDLKPALPAPAGGMKLDRVDSMLEAFGPDTVLLIGGALLQYSPDQEKSARAFRKAVEEAAGTI